MFLQIDNISKKFGHHQALSNINLSVKEGEIFGLLGPNGAGKTTLIRIINQIIKQDEGNVFLDNKKISANQIEQIGYLPEERGLYKKMTVMDQAIYLAGLKGVKQNEAKIRLKEWLNKFELLPWYNKKVEQLSKGMQQKIQFIVTVLHQPKLLILDEPFSGFDPINTNILKQEILELNKQGTTIIFSTHNMSSVEEICERIALINQSKKVIDGSVNDIKNNYANQEFTVGFEGNLISFTNALWTHFELVSNITKGNIIEAKVKATNQGDINKLAQQIIPAVKIKYIKENLPSMNDIFIELVSQNKLKNIA